MKHPNLNAFIIGLLIGALTLTPNTFAQPTQDDQSALSAAVSLERIVYIRDLPAYPTELVGPASAIQSLSLQLWNSAVDHTQTAWVLDPATQRVNIVDQTGAVLHSTQVIEIHSAICDTQLSIPASTSVPRLDSHLRRSQAYTALGGPAGFTYFVAELHDVTIVGVDSVSSITQVLVPLGVASDPARAVAVADYWATDPFTAGDIPVIDDTGPGKKWELRQETPEECAQRCERGLAAKSEAAMRSQEWRVAAATAAYIGLATPCAFIPFPPAMLTCVVGLSAMYVTALGVCAANYGQAMAIARAEFEACMADCGYALVRID